MKTLRGSLLVISFLVGAAVAQAPVPSLPKNVPGTVNLWRVAQAPVKVVKPVYPQPSLQKWIQGTVTLDVVIGTDGKVEMVGCDDYCHQFPADLQEAAAETVKQWEWAPILVKGKVARVRTKAAVEFKLDESTPAISVCNIIQDPKNFVGRTVNVFGSAQAGHDMKVLTSSECAGELELEDDSALTPPVKDGKYSALQQGVAVGKAPVTVRGLIRQEQVPGNLGGYRLILERVLKAN